MAFVGWWPFRRRRRHDPYAHAKNSRLDVAMPLRYEMSQTNHQAALRRVEDLIWRLGPSGLDAGSREVLNNLINAWGDQALAELSAARSERQEVNDILIGLAREEAARCKPRYEADLARVAQAGAALAVTFEELTGKKASEVVLPRRPQADLDAVEATLGPIDISDDGILVGDEYPRAAAATESDGTAKNRSRGPDSHD